jgi:hypothetical protein
MPVPAQPFFLCVLRASGTSALNLSFLPLIPYFSFKSRSYNRFGPAQYQNVIVFVTPLVLCAFAQCRREESALTKIARWHCVLLTFQPSNPLTWPRILIYPLYFQIFPHSFPPRETFMAFVFMILRALSIMTGVYVRLYCPCTRVKMKQRATDMP